jgi:tetratricopeptide (TPR) repeat protein
MSTSSGRDPARSYSRRPYPLFKQKENVLQRIWKQITLKRFVVSIIGLPLVVYLISDARRQVIILDPVVVPKQFVDSGLTSDVITERVKEKMEEIQRTNEYASSRAQLSMHDAQSLPNIEIPETKLSLQVVSDVLRKVLQNEPRHLRGEIISSNSNGSWEIRCSMLRSGDLIQTAKTSETSESKTNQLYADPSVESLAIQFTKLTDPYLAGFYLKENEKPEQALEVAQRMFLSSSDTNHIYEKADLLRSLIDSDRASSERDADNAIAKSRAITEQDPGWAYAHHCLAMILHRHKRFDQAAEEYKNEIKINETQPSYRWRLLPDPTLAYAHNNLGLVLSDQGDSLADRGDLLNAKNKRDLAARELQRAIQFAPTDADIHNNLGLLLWALGDNDRAAKEFQLAINFDPRSFRPHANLAGLRLDQDRVDQSQTEYHRAIEVAGDDSSTHRYLSGLHYNLGVLFQHQGKDDQADAEFKIAHDRDPNQF